MKTRFSGSVLSIVGAAVTVLGLSVLPAHAAHAPAPAKNVTCGGHAATIVGTNGDDRIVGTNGKDVIAAQGGDDLILGLQGQDTVCGGGGNDVINAMSGDSPQKISGGGGQDLCIYPHQESSNTHSCESQQQPDPLESDPPDGGTSKGNVLRDQSVAEKTSCSQGNGKINISVSGKVSADFDDPANVLIEPSLFTYHRSSGKWERSDLAVHTKMLPGYDGHWNKFTVNETDTNHPAGGIYYIGYYIQWYTPDGQSIDGNLWTFATDYPQHLKGASQNVGLCLPKFG